MNDFQSRSRRSGDRFEYEVASRMQAQGWAITATNMRCPHTAVEVDIVAVTPNGVTVWCECKGGECGTPGAQRTDNVLKALGTGLILHTWGLAPPYVIFYSAGPVGGSVSQRWIDLTDLTAGIHHVPLPRDGQDKRRFGDLDAHLSTACRDTP